MFRVLEQVAEEYLSPDQLVEDTVEFFDRKVEELVPR